MSPEESVGERAYRLLKGTLAVGEHQVGRIDVAGLARSFGTSVTPVREAALRLVGEQLVELAPEGGFRAIQLGEARLRELYALNLKLSLLALGWGSGGTAWPPASRMSESRAATLEAAARHLFQSLASACGNAAFGAVMNNLSDHLAPAREAETSVFPDALNELRQMSDNIASRAWLVRALRRYHQRRLNRVPSVIWEIRRSLFK